MVKFDRIKYNRSYIKNNYKPLCLKFDKEKDKDVIEHLDGIQSKKQYIVDLIRADMKEGK